MLGEVQQHKLAEARRVGVVHGRSVAVRLEDGHGLDEELLDATPAAGPLATARTSACYRCRYELHDALERLGLAGATLTRDDHRLAAALQHSSMDAGSRAEDVWRHIRLRAEVSLERLLRVELEQLLARIDRQKHGTHARVDVAGEQPLFEHVAQRRLGRVFERRQFGHRRHGGRVPLPTKQR